MQAVVAVADILDMLSRLAPGDQVVAVLVDIILGKLDLLALQTPGAVAEGLLVQMVLEVQEGLV
jgi:hypothetical protein